MKRCFAVMLALAVLCALWAPATVLAAEADTVSMVEIGGLEPVVAGQYALPINAQTLSVAANAAYYVESGQLQWRGENDAAITDHNYTFEAGCKYSLMLAFRIKNGSNARFSPTAQLVLQRQNTAAYTSYVLQCTGDRVVLRVVFTVPGSRQYPAVASLSLSGLTLPREGDLPDTDVSMLYANARVESVSWDGPLNGGRFAGGQIYTANVRVLASAQYDFSASLAAYMDGRPADAMQPYTSGSRKGMNLKFVFAVPNRAQIGRVQLQGLPHPYACERGETVRASQLTVTDSVYKLTDATLQWNYISDRQPCFLYHVDTTMDLTFAVTDNGYKFTETCGLTLIDFEPTEYTVQTLKQSNDTITFRLHVLPGFRPGAGGSENDPAVCTDYRNLKGALEDPGLRYVQLNRVGTGTSEISRLDPAGKEYVAIRQEGVKTLILLDTNEFYCTSRDKTRFPIYTHFIQVLGTLDVKGSGQLIYQGPGVNSNGNYNSLFYNSGNLTVHDGVTLSAYTLKGTGGLACNGVVIHQEGAGKTVINNAVLLGKTTLNTEPPTAAVMVASGTLEVNGARVENRVIAGSGVDNVTAGSAIYVKGGTARLHAGTFEGLLLRDGLTLAGCVDSGAYVARNGAAVNPANLNGAIDGVITIARYVEQADLHVNFPVADESPSLRVYNPQNSVLATDVTWFDATADRAMGFNDTFIAGHVYRVVLQMRPAAGYRFVTNGNATATAFKVNDRATAAEQITGTPAAEGCRLTYEFAPCPYLVNQVALTLAPPLAGNTAGSAVTTAGGHYRLYPTDAVSWRDDTAGRSIANGTPFEAGHVYTVFIWVQAAEDYEFAVDDRLDPAINATVNGQAAMVRRAYEQSADEVVEIVYTFEACTDQPYITALDAAVARPAVGGYADRTVAAGNSTYAATLVHYLVNGQEAPADYAFTWGDSVSITVGFAPAAGFRLSDTATATVAGLEARPAGAQNGMRLYTVTIDLSGQPPVTVAYGDVNDDGKVDAKDALLVLKAAVGKAALSNEQQQRANVDGDNAINAKDALLILKRAVNKIDRFPVEG